MINRKVYLAGPITGTSYEECTNWRDSIKYALEDLDLGIECYSPMRGKAYLSKEDEISDSYNDFTMSSITGINIRDYNDVITSGVVLVNLLNSKKVSIGTVMEIAWARMKQIPIVIIMEKEGNIHDHGMLTYNCIRVTSLDEAYECVCQLLLLP